MAGPGIASVIDEPLVCAQDMSAKLGAGKSMAGPGVASVIDEPFVCTQDMSAKLGAGKSMAGRGVATVVRGPPSLLRTTQHLQPPGLPTDTEGAKKFLPYHSILIGTI